jgi:hypothetical protein
MINAPIRNCFEFNIISTTWLLLLYRTTFFEVHQQSSWITGCICYVLMANELTHGTYLKFLTDNDKVCVTGSNAGTGSVN